MRTHPNLQYAAAWMPAFSPSAPLFSTPSPLFGSQSTLPRAARGKCRRGASAASARALLGQGQARGGQHKSQVQHPQGPSQGPMEAPGSRCVQVRPPWCKAASAAERHGDMTDGSGLSAMRARAAAGRHNRAQGRAEGRRRCGPLRKAAARLTPRCKASTLRRQTASSHSSPPIVVHVRGRQRGAR